MLERSVVAAVLGLGLAGPVLAAAAAVTRVSTGARGLAWVLGGAIAAALIALAFRARRWLPASLDGAARRRPLRAGAWLLLAVIALAQLGRLSAFMADPALTFGSAFPDPKLTAHMCMSAYVQAAALARDGDPNLYDERHWPTFAASDDGAPSPVEELGPHVKDAYEYPPQFLLVPRLGLALTNHFLILRAVWFVVQLLGFVAVALALAWIVGGREGLVIGLLIPALVASISFLINLQWGQAHLATFTLSLGALAALRRDRTALGGLLLGAAIVFKLFPGLLLVYLALRRRWRAVGWTLASCAALTLVALAVVGRAPFEAFVHYQLPRIGNGQAFSFFWDDAIAVSRNLGVSGIVFKLRTLGVPGMSARVAGAVGWVYTLVLLALTWRVSRLDDRAPLDEALAWMGLLCLGSLRSPLAPGVYVSFGALWLLMLIAPRIHRKRDVAAIVLGFVVIPGGPPLPGNVPVDIALAFVGQALMIALGVLALSPRVRA
jgi:hypothetical protein